MAEKLFRDGEGDVLIVPSHLFKVKRNESGTNIIAVNGEVIATVEEVICDYCNAEVPDLIEAEEGINKFYLPAPLAVIHEGSKAICFSCLRKYYPAFFEAQQQATETLMIKYKQELIRQGLIVIKDGREEKGKGKGGRGGISRPPCNRSAKLQRRAFSYRRAKLQRRAFSYRRAKLQRRRSRRERKHR